MPATVYTTADIDAMFQAVAKKDAEQDARLAKLESAPPAPGPGPTPPPVPAPSWIETLLADMQLPNDLNPGAMIDNPRWGTRLYGGYTNDQYAGGGTRVYPWVEVVPPHPSVTPWTASAPNTIVECCGMGVQVKVPGGVWKLELARPDGKGWWADAFYDRASYDAPVRPVQPLAIPGGIAQPANEMGFAGPKWVWHFYPAKPPENMVPSSGAKDVAYCVHARMRLGLRDPNGPDDRHKVILLGHVAADWYGPNGPMGPVMQARFKLLTPEFQDFTATNITTFHDGRTFPGALTAEELRADPPLEAART